MALSDQLRRMDAHSGVSKEFRVYTVQGAVLSVITVVGTFYCIFTGYRLFLQQERILGW